jgi:hypothetical protein
MAAQKISENFSELADNVKRYVQLKIDLLKLNFLEKFSKLVSFVVITLVFFLLFLFIVLFISMGFIFWFRDNFGHEWLGAIIVACFYLLMGIVIWLFRFRLFLNPVVARLSKILFEDEDEEK